MPYWKVSGRPGQSWVPVLLVGEGSITLLPLVSPLSGRVLLPVRPGLVSLLPGASASLPSCPGLT